MIHLRALSGSEALRRFARGLFFFLPLMAAFRAGALTIDVKPEGPVSDLAAARDAARKARADGEQGVIAVRIADGTYSLTEPVTFEPRDSNVAYIAAEGAKPVFVGGRKITGFKAGADGVWTAQIPEARDGKWYFEALWVNGKRATRARTPNEGFYQATGQPKAALPDVPPAGDVEHTVLQFKPEDLASLRGLSAQELRDVNVYAYHAWDVNHHRIAGARFEDGTLQFTGGGGYAFFKPEPWQRIHFENYRAALDAPGEWFLARDGTLSYIPRAGETLETAEVWAPVARKWILIQGDPEHDHYVTGLRFQGLSFRWQAYELPEKGVHFGQAEALLGATIEADGAKNLTFEGCEFSGTLTHTMWLRSGCHECAVRHCWLHDLGAGGIYIGNPDVSKEGPKHTSAVTVEDCIIHSGGRYFTAGIGVVIFHASDCAIRHCDIGDFYYSAVSVGWTWGYQQNACARNLVEECNLHHLGWAILSDMAAVYTLGPQPGTVIRGCNMHDIGAATYGGWGMYNDEGSTGIVWENNLVHETQDSGYHQHYGRGNIVRNNIIAFCAEEHLRRSRAEDFFAFAFERNIVLLGPGKLLAIEDKNWLDGHVDLHSNVYWKPDGPIKSFAGKSWNEWQFSGQDAGSVVADPLFVDPAHGDWTLHPESPALKVGFVPFDWKKAGVSGDAAWKKLAAEEFPRMKYGKSR